MYLSVVQVADAGPDGTGAVVELHTKGWLPYTLRWTLTITEPMTDTGFALTAAGDLNGTGRWTFTTGRTRSGHHLRLARQGDKTVASAVELAAQAGVLGESSLGHGPG